MQHFMQKCNSVGKSQLAFYRFKSCTVNCCIRLNVPFYEKIVQGMFHVEICFACISHKQGLKYIL